MAKNFFIICVILLLTACSKNIEEIETISVDYLNSSESSVTRVEMTDEDIEVCKNILENKTVSVDNGFNFAEGGYRLVIRLQEETLFLYPYCGSTSVLRVGDEDNDFIWLEKSEEENLKRIINKYIDCDKYGGIWDWQKVNN